MAEVKSHKVVSALPAVLEADSLYLVRVGNGFDLYVTNHAGIVVAYPLNPSPGATPTVVEVDFAHPAYEATFDIAHSGMTATSLLTVVPLGLAATGKDADEAELDKLVATAIPYAGGFTLCLEAVPGPAFGKYKFLYTVT